MIHIIEGRIGSGKTYWCVSYILRLFYDWDDRFFQFFPKKDIPKIITNIKGLNIGTVIDLNKLLDGAGSLEDLFFINPVTYELRHKVFENSVLIIDEAQSPRFFPRLYKSASVMLFFQLHRHFGSEVFMTTQDVKSLCPDLRELPEYHLRCVRQSLQLGRFFTYRKYYDTEAGATSRVKRDHRIFDCYKSAESGIEHKKVSSALMRYVYIMAVCLVLFVLGGFAFKTYFFGGNRSFAASPTPSPVPAPVVSSAPSPVPALVVSSVPSVSPVSRKFPIYGLSIVQAAENHKTELELVEKIKEFGVLRAEVVTLGKVVRKYEYNGFLYTFSNNVLIHKTVSAAARSGVSVGASEAPYSSAGDLVKNTNNSNTDYKNNIRQ